MYEYIIIVGKKIKGNINADFNIKKLLKKWYLAKIGVVTYISKYLYSFIKPYKLKLFKDIFL